MDIKQVIVMRKDLGMRKGKMIAQGAHASTINVLTFLEKKCDSKSKNIFEKWISGNFKKIVVSVDSEEELLDIMKKANEKNLVVNMIQDLGLTEFHGNKTYTCLAIGPDLDQNIDPITSNLKLL